MPIRNLSLLICLCHFSAEAAEKRVPARTVVCQPLVGISDHGDVRQTRSFASLVAASRSTPARIVLIRGRHPVRSDLYVPRATVLEFEPGAVLEIAKTATMTVDGFIDAGPWRVFAL